MSFPGPPFDHELAVIMDQPQFAPDRREFTKEYIIEQRKAIEPFCGTQQVTDDPDLSYEEVTVPGLAWDVTLSIIRSKTLKKENNPGIYLIHGGGMVLGNRLFLIGGMLTTIKALGAVLVSVEYRLAPEYPAPAAVEDCYAGLQWMLENAPKLGLDVSRIIVAGGSAGGGLAAGVALLNRDRKGPPLFAQLLMYPMLDDRCTSISVRQYENDGMWTGKTNRAAWDHYLPGVRGTDKVSIYDAPSRAEDLSNLPQAFIEVGASEPFRDEAVAYATKLWECGIQAELHAWPGAWHGYNVYAPGSQIAQVSNATRFKWLERILAAPASPIVPAAL
ncbi:hypothetical protein EG329_003069 [Mollisiaceae sp. DMI_Dod_QoI]|nr:hypothetical protein EG329_003069 [Helotiales sp. DMI_Dod_QoI]